MTKCIYLQGIDAKFSYYKVLIPFFLRKFFVRDVENVTIVL